MREHPAYRDNLEELKNYFDPKGKRFVTATEVAEWAGRDRRTVAKLWKIPKEGITLATLARNMCK